jgi:hypothetical protein
MPDCTAANSAVKPSRSARMRLAQTANRSPSAVRPSKLWPRWMRVTPTSRSNFAIDADNAGCDTKHASAARAKCRSRATATKYSSCRNSIARPVLGEFGAINRALGGKR